VTNRQDAYIDNHKFSFEIPIIKFPGNWENNQVAFIKNTTIQTNILNFSKNNKLFYAKMPDNIDIVITKSNIIIKPKNIFGDTHLETIYMALEKTFQVIEKLIEQGFEFKNDNGIIKLIQTSGHFAETNSLLSDFFEKNNLDKFNVKNKEGKTLFWIDHSDGKRHDETDDETKRLRLNNHLNDIMENEVSNISKIELDLEKMKEIMSNMIKLEILKQNTINLQNGKTESISTNTGSEKIFNYFG
jgi:hypothetical protein